MIVRANIVFHHSSSVSGLNLVALPARHTGAVVWPQGASGLVPIDELDHRSFKCEGKGNSTMPELSDEVLDGICVLPLSFKSESTVYEVTISSLIQIQYQGKSDFACLIIYEACKIIQLGGGIPRHHCDVVSGEQIKRRNEFIHHPPGLSGGTWLMVLRSLDILPKLLGDPIRGRRQRAPMI